MWRGWARASGAGVSPAKRRGWTGARHELVEMADHRVGNKLAQRFPRVAEAHQDGRHAGVFGRADVNVAVPHHDGAGRLAARLRDHSREVPGVWLRHGEGVAPGNTLC